MSVDTMVHVVLFEPDLLFSSKIESTAKRLNVNLKVITDIGELTHELETGKSTSFILNLDSLEGKLSIFKKHVDNSTLTGYYSHVKAQLADEAKRAGIQTVVSRGAFASRIQEILADISTKQGIARSG